MSARTPMSSDEFWRVFDAVQKEARHVYGRRDLSHLSLEVDYPRSNVFHLNLGRYAQGQLHYEHAHVDAEDLAYLGYADLNQAVRSIVGVLTRNLETL